VEEIAKRLEQVIIDLESMSPAQLRILLSDVLKMVNELISGETRHKERD